MDSSDPHLGATGDAATLVPKFLYRFRPLKRLLENGELEKQEIYFAAPSQLNDPMEGFRDLFWKGDRIVWENLFKHYLRCLNWTFSMYAIAGESHPLIWNDVPIVGPMPSELNTEKLDALQQGIFGDFLAEPAVIRLVDALDGRALPVRRDELRSYLRCLHPLALGTVWSRNELHRTASARPDAERFLDSARAGLPSLEKMIEAMQPISGEVDEQLLQELFSLFEFMSGQLGLAALLNPELGEYQPNKDFLFRAFADEFVDQLDRLVYPDWHVACFMSDCRNASLWGTYGDSHTGICLVFNTVVEGGRPFLPLTRVNGFGSSGYSRGRIEHEFHQVKYSDKHQPVDFFRSIGRLPEAVLDKHWHSNAEGARSVCASNYDDQWRADYWKGFYPGATTKLADWAHEDEYRLLLTGMVLDFSDAQRRTATYDFRNLHGLIFGMKTPLEKRIEICRIVAEKCRANGRSDFKFYEAYYSAAGGRIDHRELNLLRLTASISTG
ncbi:DUF2971 domain-containing protein [Variovorax guangxiensis]|nr:DUF2971 domain-containing protein [Variovorax guangxiensis]